MYDYSLQSPIFYTCKHFWDHFRNFTKTAINFIILFPKIENWLNVAIQLYSIMVQSKFSSREMVSDRTYVFRTQSKQVMNLASFFVCFLNSHTKYTFIFLLINTVLLNTIKSYHLNRLQLKECFWSLFIGVNDMTADYFSFWIHTTYLHTHCGLLWQMSVLINVCHLPKKFF